jgi:F-type H+-transporting ATPase subunit delta
MTLSAVAKRYADALADVVTQGESKLRADQAAEELRAFENALQISPDLREILSTPAAPPSRKKAVVGRIADVLQLSRPIRNFLFVLIDHRRITLLADIIPTFELVVDERLGFARADVTAAMEFSERQRASLATELEQLTGKRIRMRFAIDSGLIGGVVARIGSTVYDGSVRGQLESLERLLGAES